MARWQGKSKGTSAGYKIFVFLLKTTGLKGSYIVLRFVTLYYFFFSPSTSRHILTLYRNILNFSKSKAWLGTYRNYYNLGQALIDKVAIMAGIKTNFTFEFEGEAHLHTMISGKKGGLLLSGHLGNWEAAGHLLKRLNTRIHIVMFDGEDAQIKEYIDSVTGPKNFNVILVKNDLSHIYKISEALSMNEVVCMHADRFLPGNKTLTTNFFGQPAKFPEGPFILALKLKAPVVFVYAFKEGSNHYHLYSTDIKQYSSASGDTMQSILSEYAVSMEEMTKKYPYQWFNYYNFWDA